MAKLGRHSDIKAMRAWMAVSVLAFAVVVTAMIVLALLFRVVNIDTLELEFFGEGTPTLQVSDGSARDTAERQPGFIIVGEDGMTWSSAGIEIKLFSAHYDNAAGETVVETADGADTVAPGTSGTYTFSARNASDTPVGYVLSGEIFGSTGADQVPLEVRMRSSRGWIIGGEDTWGSLADLNSFKDTATLAGRHSSTYMLEWRWPFERGDDSADADAADTLLGNLILKGQEVQVSVSLDAVATNVNDAGDTDGNSGGWFPGGELMKTGDWVLPVIVIVIVALLACLFAIILYKRRKKEEDGDDHAR